jgi:hypothetical protein
VVAADRHKHRKPHLNLLSRPRRAHRSHEWDAGKAVTFIVTLAATRCVTLAAKESGMSRKSAYALKDRDPAFAAAWKAAVKPRRGDKSDKSDRPRMAPAQGDGPPRASLSKVSTAESDMRRKAAEAERDRFFARLAFLSGRAPPPREVSL